MEKRTSCKNKIKRVKYFRIYYAKRPSNNKKLVWLRKRIKKKRKKITIGIRVVDNHRILCYNTPLT